MAKKNFIYAVSTGTRLFFFGFRGSRAAEFARNLGTTPICFTSESVREWRCMPSIEEAARGTEPLTIQEALALQAIGPNMAPCTISTFCKTTLLERMMMQSIRHQLERYEVRQKVIRYYQTALTELNGKIKLSEEQVMQIMEVLAEHQDNFSEKDLANDLDIVRDILKQDSGLDESEISAETVIEALISIVNSHKQKELSDDNKEKFKNIKNYSNKNKLDPKMIKMIHRWEKRCEILDIIKDNDVNGFGKSQRDIANQAKCSLGLVNKIYQLYNFDNNLSKEDLYENKRGAKPDPFKKIPEDLFHKLYEVCSKKGPVEEDLPFRSWSAAAIFYYLRKNGVKVKLSYIYDFCHKMGITSKFSARKNPKENEGEISYFLTVKFPKICAESIINNEKIIFLDESHVMISPHFKGYSFVNTNSVASYSTGLDHSIYTILTFIGLDGFIEIYTIKGSVDSSKFTDIMQQFKNKHKKQKFIIMMDNSPVHTSYESLGWFVENSSRFKIYFLPRYCPRLNVVEFFNNIFKGELKKDSAMTNAEMLKQSDQIVAKYNKNKDDTKKVIKSLFKNKECSYIERIFEQEKNNIDNKVAA